MKRVNLSDYWTKESVVQAHIRAKHPRLSDLVFRVLDDHEVGFLEGRYDDHLINAIGTYLVEEQGQEDVSDNQIIEALCTLHEEGLIDYERGEIATIYSPFNPRRACVY